MTKNQKVLAAVLGVVAVGGVIILATKSASASTTAAAAPGALPGTPGTPLPSSNPAANPVTTTLVSGQPILGPIGVQVGAPYTIMLPPGAVWAAGAQLPSTIAVGSATPITWQYNGPTSISLNWVDPSGTAQSTSVTLFTLSSTLVPVQPVPITLVPNFTTTGAIPVAPGSPITISLPAGAQWASGSSVSGAIVPVSGTATPLTLTYSSPVVFHLNWTDSTGTSQVSNLSFYTP